MARCIQEGDQAIVVAGLIGTYMLGDAARLFRNHTGLAHGIQQSGLAVIHMPQDGDHWGARFQILFILTGDHAPPKRDFANFGFQLVHCFQAGFITHFSGNYSRGIEINLLIDVCHHTIRHQCFDHINRAGFHHLSQIAHAKTARQLNSLNLLFFGFLCHRLCSFTHQMPLNLF